MHQCLLCQGPKTCTTDVNLEGQVEPLHFQPAQVESNPWCRDLIAQRQHDGLADRGPIYSDVTTCKLEQDVDGFLAGFPCQGICKAGHGLGLKDARTSLVKHVFRLYNEQPVPPNLY